MSFLKIVFYSSAFGFSHSSKLFIRLSTLITSLICFALITACAQQSPQPAVDIAKEIGPPQAGKAVLITFRQRIKLHQYAVDVLLNEQPFAELSNYTLQWAYLEPGDYTLTTRWPNGALIPQAERQLTVEADRYYLVEMRGGVGVAVLFKKKEFQPTNTYLQVGSYDDALKWLGNCCRRVGFSQPNQTKAQKK